MSEVIAFKTHPSFEGKMETTLEGFIKRFKQWLDQRNSFDVDHSGTKYFEERLVAISTAALRASANKQPLNVVGLRHNFDEEGTGYSYVDFEFKLDALGAHPLELTLHAQDDVLMVNRCKHYFYVLPTDGEDNATAIENIDQAVLEESIPNADVESIIGNLLMMRQLPMMQLYELASVVLRMLKEHRITLLLKEIEKTGTFYLYHVGGSEVVSIAAMDYLDSDNYVPLKPTLVDDGGIFSRLTARTVATHYNRRTMVVV